MRRRFFVKECNFTFTLHCNTLNSTLTQGKEMDGFAWELGRKIKSSKQQYAAINEPNEGDCHCNLLAAPKGGRRDKVLRWDCRVSHPRVHLLKGQWGMGQEPTSITQLLCKLTFPTPWLVPPILACPSSQ